jgi:type I restriction enzyme M protein
MIPVLKDDGKAGVVLPHGTLFRSGTEGAIREKLLKADLVEGIVGLPAALFYNTGIPASIWIINKNKPKHLKNKVVVVDASTKYKEGKNQNVLLDVHIKMIVEAYDHFVMEAEVDTPVSEKFARLVDVSDIAGNDYNLNITRYIDTSEREEEIHLHHVKATLLDLEAREKEIDERLSMYLNDFRI